jgi:hypothetical protein
MLIHRMKIFLIIALVISLMIVVSAQPTDYPLILKADNQLWKAELNVTGLIKLTNTQAVDSFAVSPTGQFVAYEVDAEITEEVIAETGGLGGGPLPSDIRMVNVMTGEVYEIAGQPEDVVFYRGGGVEDNAVAHGNPVWSPDSEQFAWTTLRFPGQSLEFGMYDLRQDAVVTQPLDLPPYYGIPTPLSMVWGPGGLLAMLYPSFEDNEERLYVIVLNDLGDVIWTLTPDIDSDVHFSSRASIHWLSDTPAEEPNLLYVGDYLTGILINTDTGAFRRHDGVIEAYHPSAPDGLRTRRVADTDDENVWEIISLDMTRYPVTLSSVWDVPVLGPDGTVAVLPHVPTYGELALWLDGTQSPLAGTGEAGGVRVTDVDWGPLAFRLVPGMSSTAATDCPGLPGASLGVGLGGAVVTGFGANNLRAAPSTSAEVIAVMPEGAEFTVIGGVVCADGFRWWEVDYNGQVGWTADGQGNEVWLGATG